jgi:hypothetical protein
MHLSSSSFDLSHHRSYDLLSYFIVPKRRLVAGLVDVSGGDAFEYLDEM